MTDEEVDEQAWKTFDRNTPEAFWDVAVWQENGWVTGSLDVADRKRIGLAVIAGLRANASPIKVSS